MSSLSFLHPGDAAPDERPEPGRLARRRAVAALLLATAMLAGGLALASHHGPGIPAPKPGPRRYPPAYWRSSGFGKN